MNKQERDELRAVCDVGNINEINSSWKNRPYQAMENDKSRYLARLNTFNRTVTPEKVTELLDRLDAHESVVEAASGFVNFKGRNGSTEHVLLYSDLVTEIKALEGLEDETSD